jgi:hypothetical protein
MAKSAATLEKEEKAAAREHAAKLKAERAAREDARWQPCTGCGFSRRTQLSPVGDTDVLVIVRHNRYIPYLSDPRDGDVPAHMSECPGSLSEPAVAAPSEPVADSWPPYFGAN